MTSSARDKPQGGHSFAKPTPKSGQTDVNVGMGLRRRPLKRHRCRTGVEKKKARTNLGPWYQFFDPERLIVVTCRPALDRKPLDLPVGKSDFRPWAEMASFAALEKRPEVARGLPATSMSPCLLTFRGALWHKILTSPAEQTNWPRESHPYRQPTAVPSAQLRSERSTSSS